MFVRFAGRLLINVASLNAQGGAGTNYVEITKVPVVLRDGNGKLLVEEVPAISGNMMKHFHFVNFVELVKDSKYNKNRLSQYDLRFVAYRFKESEEKIVSDNVIELNNESTIIENFAIADVHGYLIPTRPPYRRESLIKFSFVIPCEETIKDAFDISAVTQNRVVIDETGKIEGTREEQAMMVFKRQYASALYGFASTFDAYYVGMPLSNPNKVAISNAKERKERAKLAVLAYIILLGGRFGAGTSRGLPALEVDELITVVSEKPIPMAKHGFYSDYVEETIKVFKDYAEAFNVNVDVFVYSKGNINNENGSNKVTITKCKTFVELLQKVAEKVEKGFINKEKQAAE